MTTGDIPKETKGKARAGLKTQRATVERELTKALDEKKESDAQYEQARKDAETHLRLLEQEKIDNDAALEDRLAQLGYVKDGGSPVGATPTSKQLVAETPEPVTVVVQTPEPAKEAKPTPEPQEAFGLEKAQEVTPRLHRLNPQGWDWRRWWWLIVLFTIVGFIFATVLWGWFVQAWLFSMSVNFVPLSWTLTVIYWIGMTVAGLFFGGWLSQVIDERRNPNPEVTTASSAA